MQLTQGLHRAVQSSPDAVATIHAGRRRTFTEHADRVARLASALHGLGVQEGDRVAILSLNSDRYAEYLLAVPWAGAVVNPVNIRWSPAEIVHSLRDSGTTVLLVDDAFAPMVPALTAEVGALTAVVHCGDGVLPEGLLSYEELVASHEPVEDARRSGDDLAGVFYTGGTTGLPKGVMLSHTNLVTSAMGAMASGELVRRGSVLLHAAPMFHLADLAAWTSQVLQGGTHVTVPFFDPPAVLAAIEEHRVSDVLLVPTMIQMLVDHPAVADHDLSSLRRLLYGGSVISVGVLERTLATLPGVRLTQAYGMTELSPVATLLLPDEHEGDRLTSGGRPALHAEVRVVDADDRPVPAGTVGEICVRGAHVMLGYWNRPEETADALRGGWMHTGDGGYVDLDGYVHVVDRIKDMIVTGGENVYSAEVESALSKHPSVAQVAVVGLPDERFGERVHAYVVAAPGAQVDPQALQDHARTLIARYKVPRSFTVVDALPMSGAGKILKRELRQRAAEEVTV